MIVVTGATGLVGRALGDVLSQGRRPVLLVVRRGGAVAGLEEEEARAVTADVTDAERLRAVLPESCRAVIHLAGESPGHAPESEDLEVRSMQALLAALRHRDIERFVFVSATGASERAPVAWLRRKARAEQLLRDSGLPWVILRSGPVFATDDRLVNALAEVVAAGRPLRLPLFRGGSLRPLASADLAIAAATSLDHHLPLGRVVDVGGEVAVSLPELLHWIAERLGRKLALVRNPLRGIALHRALAEIPARPLTDAVTLVRWFAATEAPDVAEYGRLLPMRRVALREELRNYPWGPPPPRPGERLPVVQESPAFPPLFIPGPRLRDAGESGPHPGSLGRVDPFGKPESRGGEDEP